MHSILGMKTSRWRPFHQQHNLYRNIFTGDGNERAPIGNLKVYYRLTKFVSIRRVRLVHFYLYKKNQLRFFFCADTVIFSSIVPD